jgi:MerR family transcriptional regulator, mercuric resistance operon regulatory protein
VKSYTIGKLAKELNINVETVRFYQRKGLIKIPSKIYGPYREYTAHDLKRIRLILTLKGLNFKLDEIKTIFELLDRNAPAKKLIPIIEYKIISLERKKVEIARSTEHLNQVLESLSKNGTFPEDCEIKLPL